MRIKIHYGINADDVGHLSLVVELFKPSRSPDPLYEALDDRIHQKIMQLVEKVKRYILQDSTAKVDREGVMFTSDPIFNSTDVIKFSNVSRDSIMTVHDVVGSNNDYIDPNKIEECLQKLDQLIERVPLPRNVLSALAFSYGLHGRCGSSSSLKTLPKNVMQSITEYTIGREIEGGDFFVASATIKMQISVNGAANTGKFGGDIQLSLHRFQYNQLPIVVVDKINEFLNKLKEYIVQQRGTVCNLVPVMQTTSGQSAIATFTGITPEQAKFIANFNELSLNYAANQPEQFGKNVDELIDKINQAMPASRATCSVV